MYPARPGLLIGFHACDQSVRHKIVNNRSMLHNSANDYDWLGNGMYFWENNRQRAFDFAENLHANPPKGKEVINDPVVLGAVIDLGFCLDLLKKEFIGFAKQSYDTLKDLFSILELSLPQSTPLGTSKDLLMRKLDCVVIENIHSLQRKENGRPFDSARGVFIEGEALYPTAGFYEKSHIQLCIRNPNCIKGFFIPREEDPKWLVP